MNEHQVCKTSNTGNREFRKCVRSVQIQISSVLNPAVPDPWCGNASKRIKSELPLTQVKVKGKVAPVLN